MTAWLAGQTITADRLNAGEPQVQQAVGTSLSVTTTTFTDVPGATVTFSVTGANAYVDVSWTYDASPTVTASNNVLVGGLLLDGSQQQECLCDDRVSRATPSDQIKVAVGAGAHTIKIAAKRAAGTFTINDALLTVRLYDLP